MGEVCQFILRAGMIVYHPHNSIPSPLGHGQEVASGHSAHARFWAILHSLFYGNTLGVSLKFSLEA